MRGLVENPYELAIRPTRGTGRKRHPLGVGIAEPSKLAHPQGAVPLPSKGPALEHLLQAREECLQHDLDDLRDSAWAGLIAYRGATVPLAADATDDDRRLLRTFGLVTVFKRPEEGLTNAGLTYPRLAVTSQLTLTLDPDTSFVEAAALRSEWHTSTSGLLAALDATRGRALNDTTPTRIDRRATLLLHPELSDDLTSKQREQCERVVALLGTELDILDRGRLDSATARHRLRGNAGGSMVVVGPMDATTREIRDEYLSVDPNRLVRHVTGTGPRSIADDILDPLMELSGFSGALLPVAPADRSVKRRRGPAPFPITNPVECLRKGPRIYVRDGDTQLWWTRDDIRHGDCIFKTFEEVDGVLLHEAERDADGQPINKHKGPSGATIRRSELDGCRKPPHAHLG